MVMESISNKQTGEWFFDHFKLEICSRSVICQIKMLLITLQHVCINQRRACLLAYGKFIYNWYNEGILSIG